VGGKLPVLLVHAADGCKAGGPCGYSALSEEPACQKFEP
jgi:hypothetical protein